MVSPPTRTIRIARYGNDGAAGRQTKFTLASRVYKRHTAMRLPDRFEKDELGRAAEERGVRLWDAAFPFSESGARLDRWA